MDQLFEVSVKKLTTTTADSQITINYPVVIDDTRGEIKIKLRLKNDTLRANFTLQAFNYKVDDHRTICRSTDTTKKGNIDRFKRLLTERLAEFEQVVLIKLYFKTNSY